MNVFPEFISTFSSRHCPNIWTNLRNIGETLSGGYQYIAGANGAEAFDLGPIPNDYRDYLHFRKMRESASLKVPIGFMLKPSGLASFLTENVKIVKIFAPMGSFERLSKRNELCWVVW